MMWYFEEKNMFGKWMPRTQNDDRPTAKSPAGTRREIRNVQEVPEELRDLPLGQLHQHFNPEIEPAPEVRPVIAEEYMDLLRRLDDPERMTVGDGQEAAIVIRKLLAGTLIDPAELITRLANQVHADNVAAGWWNDLRTGEDLHGKRNVGEMLMLIVSEVSKAMEGHRKRLPDDKLAHRPMFRVELIDATIRILDLLGSEQNDVHPAGTIFQEKRVYNAQRADHKPEARLAAGGKAY